MAYFLSLDQLLSILYLVVLYVHKVILCVYFHFFEGHESPLLLVFSCYFTYKFFGSAYTVVMYVLWGEPLKNMLILQFLFVTVYRLVTERLRMLLRGSSL